MEKWMKVEPEENLFMKANASIWVPRIVQESLAADGIKYRRETVYVELGSLKKDYNPAIITKAWILLKAILGMEYESNAE